jgi:hypothetical protein
MSRQRVGKVARLPAGVREEINRRLYDGQTGKQIIRWLKIAPGDAAGLPDISDSNITQWRQGGYQEWLKSEAQVERTRERAELSMRLAKAAGGSLAQSILARIAGDIDDKLDGLSDEDVEKMQPLLNTLVDAEKARLKAIEVGQKGEALDLLRQKFQRETAKLYLKWYTDQKAKDIADQPESSADEKVERLGRLMFGEDWK